MTHREMFEKSFQRPSNYFDLSGGTQWNIDDELGILDWDAAESDLTEEDRQRYFRHYGLDESGKKIKNTMK